MKNNTKTIETAKSITSIVSNLAKIGMLCTYTKLCVLTYLKTRKDVTPEELAKLLISNTNVGITEISVAVIGTIIAKILEKKLKDEIKDEEIENEAEDIDNYIDELRAEIHEKIDPFKIYHELEDYEELKKREEDSKTDED